MTAVLRCKEMDGRILPLLARVEPIEGESLLSLIARAADANGFRRLSVVLGFAGVGRAAPGFTPFCASGAPKALGQLLSVEPSEIERRMHPSASKQGAEARTVWYGAPLERRFLEARLRRVSPAGLRASPHHRASWMVRPLGFCPETLELLTSDCPSCHRQLGWTHTAGIDRCEHCEASLLDCEPGHVPMELAGAARLLASLVSVSPSERAAAAARFPEPFSAWLSVDIYAAIFELSAAIAYARSPGQRRETLGLGRSATATLELADLAAAIDLLNDWPTGLTHLVEELWSGYAGDRSKLAEWFGPLGRHFRRKAEPGQFARLLRQAAPPAIRAARLPVKSTAVQAPLINEISEKEAVERLGISQRLLRRLDGKGRAYIAGRARVAKLYDRAALLASADLLKGAATGRSAAARLGVPEYCLPALVERGLLRAIDDPDAVLMAGGQMLIERESLDDLCAALTARGQVRDRDLPVTQALQFVFAPVAWANVYEALARGDLRGGWADRGKRRGLAEEIFVDSTVGNVLAASPLHAFDPWTRVTSTTAGALLGTGGVFISGAVDSQLLPADARPRRHAILLKDVADFATRYVLTGELIRRTSTSREIVRDQLLAAEIPTPAIIQGLSLWERSAAEAALGLEPLPPLAALSLA